MRRPFTVVLASHWIELALICGVKYSHMANFILQKMVEAAGADTLNVLVYPTLTIPFPSPRRGPLVASIYSVDDVRMPLLCSSDHSRGDVALN